MRNMNFLIPFYIVTFALIEWAYNSVGHVNSFIKLFDVEWNNHNIFAKRSCRLLVNESVHDKLSSKKLDYSGNYKLFDKKEGLTTYAKLKEDYSDNYRTYMRVLKRKYPKKKGFKKLDCYCEEKVFNAIENFDRIADSMICSKRNFIKILFKKYPLCLISFFFFISFGNLIPILNLYPCKVKDNEYETIWEKLKIPVYPFRIYSFLYWILWIIITFAVIYTLIKIVKYDGIKAGKKKMKPKEYFSFIKETYINKW
ncbi:Plasmodium exported protein, unknown function [Plasmodium vivax]|uniref:Variable surface protein n=1 Tax=Plasmodium vivax TaxID=5855 RepID=A0A1G4EGR8_PLAVI|nr:Plasmodium exported protein, unknown function [Plasmodium vivax]VUZ95036.1 Plasmodium exported protein, unknown function [Plasmodium vivax]